jgi:hypothetical protein
MKPGTQPLHSTRLLDQLRERIRYLHYSLSTEKVFCIGCDFASAGMDATARRSSHAPWGHLR